MPRIPQHRRRLKPSARVGAVSVPADVARRGEGIEEGGLEALGRGISTLGRFLFRIKSDQIDLNDSIANIEAGAITDATGKQVFTEIQSLPNALDSKGVSTWEKRAGEVFDANFEKISKLNMSDRQREITVAKWEADRDAAISRARFASVDDTIKRGKASLELLVKEAVITGDPQKTRDAEEMRAEMSSIIWGEGKEKVAAAEIARWKREGERERFVQENYRKARANEALEIQREADRDKLNDALHNNTLSYSTINASSLDEKEQAQYRGWMLAEAKRIKAGEDIVTNEEVKGNLEGMAYDIFTGAVSLFDFQKELNKARYIDKTIDDSAYDEIFSLAQREYKSYQAQALKTVVDDAARQLIDVRTDLDLFAILQIIEDKDERKRVLSERQIQFWHHSQYRKALNEWFAKNPDATADEIYIEAQKLLVHYRGRTIPEIKALLGEQEKRLQTIYPETSIEPLKKRPVITDKDVSRALGVGKGELIPDDIRYYQDFDDVFPIIPTRTDERSARSKLKAVWRDLPDELKGQIIQVLLKKQAYLAVVGHKDLQPFLEKK